jgi:5-formyltetrahydrofolate cyclo-ligase
MQQPTKSTAQIRTRILALRKQLSPQKAATAATAACDNLMQLPEFSNASHIAVYLAVNGEIGTGPLIRTAWQQQKKIYLPVLQPAGTLLFALYSPDSPLRNNHYRIPEPEITTEHPAFPASILDLLIAPLVAFDQQCQRIGMGGGYYDRTLAGQNADKPVRIGLAYEFQQVTSIQAQDWDIPMHKIVTEEKTFTRTAPIP